MNLPLTIARRYLRSKKSTNAINIITSVSVIGMIVGTMALILVLSVFNGFDDLVSSLYNTFNPDLKVTVKKGKTFEVSEDRLAQLSQIEGINNYSLVLEENAMFQYRDKVVIGTIKGVDENYTKVTAVDTAVFEGDFILQDENYIYGVIGRSIRDLLGLNIYNEFAGLKVFLPKREGKVRTAILESSFKQQTIYPKGTFSIQYEFDSKYVFVPIAFARKMLDYDNSVSAIEIALAENASASSVQKQVQSLYKDDFHVKNRYQQDEALYKVMQTEKWVVYLILTFILIVAAFNIIGSLSMIVLEKSRDIGILKAMGATKQLIMRIFLMEGLLLGLLGASIGIILAVLICLAQQHFKLLRMDGNSFLVDAYPISMRLGDFALVFCTVVLIVLLASWFPAKRATEQSQLLKGE